MKKRLPVSVKIEHILFLLAVVSICSTIIFRYMESSKFQILLSKLEYSKENGTTTEQWEDLRTAFEPFTYYNQEIDDSLNGFITLCRNPLQEKHSENVTAAYISLYKLLYQQQQQLNFGYVWTLIISFFISLVSLFSLTEKERIRKNEFKILSIVNENQLKLTREIHDGIAQDLAALKISIQNKDEEKTSFFADQALSEVRFLLENNHIELNQDFVSSLQNILANFEHNFGINTELFMASDHIKLLPTEYQFQIIRILNEALSNVARHSMAKNVVIRITDTIKGLHFIISDDGIGMDSSVENTGKHHYGIENIKSRVAEMHGTVAFDFSGGTTIAISIEDFIS